MARLRVLATVLAGVLLAAGCSATQTPTARDTQGAPTGDQTTTPGESPAAGGTLVAAIDSDPGMLNPAVTTSGATHTASELMFNGLVELDREGKPQPELAAEWQVEDGGRLYRFRLRPDVTWHDGKPFTSADVKFTFEQVLLRYHSRTKASVEPVLQSITTPDPQTVEFRFKEPYAPLLKQLDVTEAPILPKHVYEGTDPQTNPANTKPVGTGPFRFESYEPGSQIRLTKNPDYFKSGLPYLDAVVLRVIPDGATQVAALESGEVDWLFGAAGPELQRLRGNDDLRFLETAVNPGGSNCVMTVSFNLQRPIFRDVRVRRAVAHALDRQQFVDRVLFGQGKVATAPISSRITFAHASNLAGMPRFDPRRAARLLEEAGWVRGDGDTRVAQGVSGVRDGTPLSFTFLHFPNFARYGELVKAQLADVGIRVELRPLEPPVFAETVFTKRDFDTNVISYCNGADPEIGVRRMYVSTSIGPVPFSNAAAYSNPEVDRLFDAARRALQPEQRRALYRQLQEILVRDLPYVWLVETTSTRVYRAECSGFSWSGHFAEAASCRQ